MSITGFKVNRIQNLIYIITFQQALAKFTTFVFPVMSRKVYSHIFTLTSRHFQIGLRCHKINKPFKIKNMIFKS